METAPSSRQVLIRREPFPSIAYVSGLTISDEAFIDGRLVGRYWAAAGFVEGDWRLQHVPVAAFSDPGPTGGLDLSAFALDADGQSLAFGWELLGMAAEDGDAGSVRGLVELRSTLRPVRVRLCTETDGTGFFTRWLEIVNEADRPQAIGRLAVWSGMLMKVERWQEFLSPGVVPFHLGYMVEQGWGAEGAFQWMALPNAVLRLESRTGKSGFGMPFFVVKNSATGEHALGAVEWSGNWAIELTTELYPDPRPAEAALDTACLHLRLGPAGDSPLRVLAPGERAVSPRVHLGYVFEDFDGLIQRWHEHLRTSVLRPQTPGRRQLVEVNHFGYRWHELSEDSLKFEIDVAADVGAEVFTVDAGWYGDPGTDWWTTVGDWQVGGRLPGGLRPVFEYARSKGLLCGLWMDAERIGSESRLARQHPEWLARRYGKGTGASGVMDLTHPAAAQYVEDRIARLVEEFDLDVFRLDWNVVSYADFQVPRDGYQENAQWRYYEALYGLFDRLRQRFPRLILNNCAGGGGRNDLGMMRRFDYAHLTDHMAAPRSVRIANGMTMALPPEWVSLYVGAGVGEGHSKADLDFQLRAALLGHLTLSGIYPSPAERNPEHVRRIREHVALYKAFIRPMLPGCRVYHHAPELLGKEPKGWCVWEWASHDRRQALVRLFRLAGPANSHYHLRLRGPDRAATYRVTFHNERRHVEHTGDALMTQGTNVRLDRALSSEMLLLEAR